MALYAEGGWSGFSFDAVARRASVGKAPLYLRWKSKEDLLLAAITARSGGVVIQDSGDLRADLIRYTNAMVKDWSTPEGWAFLRIHLEANVYPELHARFSKELVVPHIEAARKLLCQAVQRGHLPVGAPIDLLLDSLYGAIVNRVIFGPADQRAMLADNPSCYTGAIVDFILAAAAVRAENLVHVMRPGGIR